MLWHCPDCNTSGELFLKRVKPRRFFEEHEKASPKCKSKDLWVRDDFSLDEEKKADVCKNCSHDSSHHSSDRKRCWSGASLPEEEILKGKHDPKVCKCKGYVRKLKRPVSHYNRRSTSRWWRGSLLSGA